MPPGTTVKLKVWRDGKTQDMTVKLGELPETAEKAGPGENSSGALEGVEVQDLTPEIAQQLNLPRGHPRCRGHLGRSIEPRGSRRLDRGMVIQEVNHKPVTNLQQYKQALAGAWQPAGAFACQPRRSHALHGRRTALTTVTAVVA